MAEGLSVSEKLAAIEDRQAHLLAELDSLDERVLAALEGVVKTTATGGPTLAADDA